MSSFLDAALTFHFSGYKNDVFTRFIEPVNIILSENSTLSQHWFNRQQQQLTDAVMCSRPCCTHSRLHMTLCSQPCCTHSSLDMPSCTHSCLDMPCCTHSSLNMPCCTHSSLDMPSCTCWGSRRRAHDHSATIGHGPGGLPAVISQV